MNKFYGYKKVLAVSIEEGVLTPSGAEVLRVKFEEGEDELVSKTRYELLLSEEALDPTTIQNKIRARVGAVLFGALHEYDIKIGEVNGVADAMVELVNNGYNKADSILWGVEKPDIRLLDVNNTLIKNATKNNDGVTSSGSGTDTTDTQ